METHEEVVNDLATFNDYIVDQVTNVADQRPLEELAEQRYHLQNLAGAVRTALLIVEQEMSKQVEGGAKQIGNQVYARKMAYKSRWDHADIAQRVKDHAVALHTDPTSGEVDYAAVTQTVLHDLTAIYLSDSTTGKVRVLDALGIPRKAVINNEFTGYKLSVTDLAEGEDGG